MNVSNFVQLFIIRRVLFHPTNDKGNIDVHRAIQTILTCLNEKTQQTTANKILTVLATHGIKQAIKTSSVLSNVNLIDLIFNQIILTQFKTAYAKVIKYNPNNDEHYKYHQQLFNASDLMSSIFQFLDESQLFHCSLVCSYWLYHALNPKSIYHVNLTKYIQHKCNYEYDYSKYNRKQSQIAFVNDYNWELYCNAKSIYFDLRYNDHPASKALLNKLDKRKILKY